MPMRTPKPESAEFMELTRRAVLRSATALPLVPWLGLCGGSAMAHERVKLADYPFSLGVTSGDPTARGVVIWTRLAPQPLEGGGMPQENVRVRWQVASDEAFTKIVRKGAVIATPQLGHSVHVEVDGLEPDRWYWYRFMTGGEESPRGRTRTMPRRAAVPEQFRFAFASCQHFETGHFTAYEHMAKEEIDLVVHLGDYIYEKEGRDDQVRKHAGPEITTLEHYRNRYAQYKLDPHLQEVHRLFPWVVTWDDHEFDNNYANRISEEPDVAVIDFLTRRANAYQAYYENMPLRPRSLPTGPDLRLYRAIPVGRLARIAMLDTRQYRTDQPNGDNLKSQVGDALSPRGTLLGKRQQQWLTAELLRSDATWNVLGQQVVMANVRYPRGEGGYNMDAWSGYDIERRRLLEFLSSRRVANPIVLTGDVHTNYVNDLVADPDDVAVATEFVGTSITSGGNGADKLPYTDSLVASNPFVKFHNGQRGYVRCEITPDHWTSDYRVVSKVSEPGGDVSTRATFVVESGNPGAQLA